MVELFVIPGFGVVGIGGVICLAIGAIFLIPTYSSREWVVNMAWIDNFIIIVLTSVVLIAVFFLFLLYKIIEVRQRKRAIGEFFGETAETIDEISADHPGYIRFRGEMWQAKAETTIPKDKKVSIVKKDGVVLWVEPIENTPKH